MFDKNHGLRPRTVALAVALALGLSGCGGGGGSNVRPSTPTPPPPTGTGDFAGGNINVGAGVTTVLPNDIAGSIDLIKGGAGTLVLTGTDSYTGGTTINDGTLQIGNGGTTGSITGNVVDNAFLVFDRSNNLTYGGIVSGTGSLEQAGAGTLTLTGTNTYTGGTTISDGTLRLGNGGTTGSIVGNVTNSGSLVFDRSNDLTYGGIVSGTGSLTQAGTGKVTLTGANTYTGGTTIGSGVLQIGNGGASGSIVGNVRDNGVLAFDRSDDVSFAGTVTGTGSLTKAGGGSLTLTGANSYTGATQVSSGSLYVDGNQSAASGATTVASGATLGGKGTLGGDVTIGDGAILAPGDKGAIGTFAINGNLNLSAGSMLDYGFDGQLVDLINVKGNLTLDGTLNIGAAPASGFGPGVYRVFNYAGKLADNGLVLGDMPGFAVSLQTAVANQVNLISQQGMTFSFWDGDAGPKNNGAINGGSGVWESGRSLTTDNWTDIDGAANVAFLDRSFAVFQGGAGKIIVNGGNGDINAAGMQFADDGYVLEGDVIHLVGSEDDPTHSIVRVGDGTTAGSKYKTVIHNVLAGDSTLVKSGAGTLVLDATNIYTGGTMINGGTLQVGTGGVTGSIAGNVINEGSLVFDYGGDPGVMQGYGGVISGNGTFTKSGTGTVVLSGDSTYTGGTTIRAGVLEIGDGGQAGSIVGNVTNNSVLAFNRGDDIIFKGKISGTGSLIKDGHGTLILTGDNTNTGVISIEAGSLQIGEGGTRGSITGDVVANTYDGALIFNRSDTLNYGGAVSGSSGLTKLGAGTLAMSGASTYTGATAVNAGILELLAGGSLGLTTVTVGSAGKTAVMKVGRGAAVSGAVSLEGSTLDNAGTIRTGFSGSSAVRASGASTVVNHDGGLIEGDSSQPGLDISAINLGLAGNLTNGAGSTIRGYGGVAGGGVVKNIGGTIEGITGDGVDGAAAVTNSDGGRILAGTGGGIHSFISFGVMASATNAAVTNTHGSEIIGMLGGVRLGDGGAVNNYSNSNISGATAVFIDSVSNAIASVNNNGGSKITGSQAGIFLLTGGVVNNGSNSIIEATAGNSADCSITLGCSIYVPVHSAFGDYGSNGRLALTNAGKIIGNVQMDPTVANKTTLIAGGSIQGDLNIGSNGQSILTFDGDTGTKQLYSKAVSGTTTFGGKIIKTGGGTWVVDDSSLQGVTDTSVDAGSLQATGTLSGNVVVLAAGRLEGVPGVAGSVSNAGEVSVLRRDTKVGGDFNQTSTGTLAISLGSKLDVAGSAALAGGALEVTGAESGYVSSVHTAVLTASGGLSGRFSRLVKGSGVVFTSSTIHYDANSAWLDTTGLDVTTAAAGDGVAYTAASLGSAQRVQGAFEQLNEKIAAGNVASVSGDFVRAAGQFQQAPTLQAAQASLQSLSGQLHAASAAMTFQAIDASSRVMSDRLDGLLGRGVGFGTWTQSLNTGGDMARAGFDDVGYQLNGWLVGSDRQVGRSGVAGYAFGQSQGQQRLGSTFDRDKTRSTEAMVYAGLLNGNWYTQGRVGFGRFQQDVSRQVLLGDSAQGVSTRYSGQYNVAYGESGLRFGRGNSQVTPFVDVEYTSIDRGGFSEQGAGGFGLRSNAQTLDRWQAGLGVRLGHHWGLSGGRALDFNARAQWQRTLAAHGDAFDASFVGLQQWQPLVGIGLSRYSGLLGVGIDATLSEHTALKFGYDYETGQHNNAQTASARLSIAF